MLSTGNQLDESRHYIDQLRAGPPEEAIPRLAEMLADESWYLRQRAGEALAAYGPAAAPVLEELLNAGLWYTRAAALRVLGAIAAPGSLPKVVTALADSNRAIAEDAARSILDYCRHGKAAAAAKILHARGGSFRDRALALVQRIHPEGGGRLRRLMLSPLMGPEGSLLPHEEERLAREVKDADWSVDWGRLGSSEPLPEWKENLIRFLRGVPDA
ncbi:MAG: HEAT repeat domain-containing protein [Candidatus Eisenbacteria bacterium]|nr:HEAT repeat domain-containing protein [Candidatus Eisenbacteria bacterium]